MSGHDHGREPLPPSWFEKNVDKIVRGVFGVCALLLVGDVIFHFVGHKHVHFAVEEWVGFYAIAGFVSYVGLVLTAKQLRKLVMRRLGYYGEAVPDGVPLGERVSDADLGPRDSDLGSRDSESESESEPESESESESESEPGPEPESEDDDGSSADEEDDR